jgi:hypothetical protein
MQRIGTAEEAIKRAQDAVASAKRNLTNWNSSVALLEAGIAEVPGVLEGSKQIGADTGKKGLDELKRKVGQREIEFVNADGITVKRKIQDILVEHVEDTVTGKGASLRVPDAPGATLTILMLGLDLATLEKAKAEAELFQLAKRLELYERSQAELALAEQLLDEVNLAHDENEGRVAFQRRISTLVIAARSSHDEARKLVPGEANDARDTRFNEALNKADLSMLAAANHLLSLRKLAVADSVIVRTGLSLERNVKRLDHEESILDARAKDHVWRTVLRAGVGVLDQYEQGGLKPEDVANIVRVAQTIALGAIAMRVD